MPATAVRLVVIGAKVGGACCQCIAVASISSMLAQQEMPELQLLR
jgi:hypothetical protein